MCAAARARRTAALAGLGLALAAAPAAALQLSQGEVVGRLELGAPDQQDFVLRGTLPVPPHTFPRPDGLVPLSIVDSDGTLVPTQVERVSWYPAQAQGADVVEVLGRVQLPPSTSSGTRITYDVVYDPHPRGRPDIPPQVRGLLGAPGKLVLVTRDVFGHVYTADLWFPVGSKKILRAGQTAWQVRTYGVLKPVQPVSGSSGTLPRMMGVHAYITAWAGENVLSVDLRLNNGSSGHDKNHPDDDPQAKLYFRSLDLYTPAGWSVMQAFEDPFFGPSQQSGAYGVHPIVRANSTGNLHVLGVQGQFHRRLVLTPTGNEPRARTILEESGLGFARSGFSPSGQRLWSWWNSSTARYFPQRHRLPSLDHLGAAAVRGKHNNDLNLFGGLLESGASQGVYPIHSPALGWAHPWGVKYGGMTSGTEITMFDGVEVAYGASKSGYRLEQVQHRMYSDRQPTVLFNRDGEPTRLAQWVIQGPTPWVDMVFFLTLLSGNDPFGFNQAPTFQVNAVQSMNLAPSYEGDLLQHAPIDLQHYVRYLSNPKVLAWLGNDALAKDDLMMAAEIARLSYHQYPNNPNGNATVSGMLHDMNFVASNPGVGFGFGRGEGWVVQAMTAAYSIAPPAWRAEARPWFDQMTDMVATGQAACSGFVEAIVGSKLLQGQYRARQSIEEAIVENAFRSVIASVYTGIDPAKKFLAEGVLIRSAYSMVNYPAWSTSANGPWAILAVGPLNVSQPLYCNSIPPNGTDGGHDKYQVWSTFAYAHELTGDPLFLQRALEMAGGSNLHQAMNNMNFNNIGNRTAIMALAEIVNYP